MTLTLESVSAQREVVMDPARANRVMFRVSSLYGLWASGIRMPLNTDEAIDSGPISITADAEADPATTNTGVIDFSEGTLKVKYSAQIVFPGLFDLVTARRFDASLLRPVRATATDECTLTDDYRGWRALGCLEFLPGSVWSGATGG